MSAGFDAAWAFFGGVCATVPRGDLKGGGDVGFQRVNGYEEASGAALVQYFISDTQTLELDAQILEQQNVPQYERI